MKPCAFDYARPTSLAEAMALIAAAPAAMVLAGGQTLGPMLNLRLAQPSLLVDITRIPDLAATAEERDAVTIGATVTHAAIEDGRIPDPTQGFLPRVAHGIAYRAVRTRGTIGGSLAYADPAADWIACLAALGAEAVIAGPHGAQRKVALTNLVLGAMQSAVAPGELITAVRVPKFSPAARFGYHKICRRAGEYAEAIGVAVADPARGRYRLVASTTGAPLILDSTERPPPAGLSAHLLAAGFAGDGVALSLASAALRRALAAADRP